MPPTLSKTVPNPSGAWRAALSQGPGRLAAGVHDGIDAALPGHAERDIRDVGDDDPARAEVPRGLGDAVPGGAGPHHQDRPSGLDVPLRGNVGTDGEDVHHGRLAEGQRLGDDEAAASPGGHVFGVGAGIIALLPPPLAVAHVHGVRAELGQPGTALGTRPADLRADRSDPLAQEAGVLFVEDGHDLAREFVAEDDVRGIVDVPSERVHGPGVLAGVIAEVGPAAPQAATLTSTRSGSP